MSKLGAGVRLLKLLKIESIVNELYNEDDFQYDVCFEDCGLCIQDSSIGEIHIGELLLRVQLMISMAKLDIGTEDLI